LEARDGDELVDFGMGRCVLEGLEKWIEEYRCIHD
jgi:hypothetical protein